MLINFSAFRAQWINSFTVFITDSAKGHGNYIMQCSRIISNIIGHLTHGHLSDPKPSTAYTMSIRHNIHTYIIKMHTYIDS